MKNLYVDMDDTLIPTQKLFDEVSFMCASRIKGFFHIDDSIKDVIKKMNEIDLQNIKVYGFSPERFPTSWAQTYEFYAKQKDVKICGSKRQSIYLMAQTVYSRNIPVYEHTYEMLRTLREKNYNLVLLTAGEESVQKNRIQYANLHLFFDEIVIVPMKNKAVLSQILKERNHLPTDSAMIGNSLRSDIYPALEVGMKAIHVNRETWAYDQMDIDTTNPNYISISNFDRCLDALMVKNNMEHIA